MNQLNYKKSIFLALMAFMMTTNTNYAQQPEIDFQEILLKNSWVTNHKFLTGSKSFVQSAKAS